MLLCLCSRNEPDDVWAALRRGTTLLRAEHVSASRIAPMLRKAQAVAQLATELSLGAESLMLIDDNPAECADVRAALPRTGCWCWPQQHAEARAQLHHCWPLDLAGRAAATAEDGARATSYQQAAPRRALRESATSLGGYIEALQVRVSLEPLAAASAAERERVAQLIGRTNQFNAWKRPPPPIGAAQLRCEGVTMRVADRFGDYGLVGAALCTRDAVGGAAARALSVRTFCMSCRVLGRGAEHAMLAELGRMAAGAVGATRCDVVRMGVERSERNAPVIRFLESTSRRLGGGHSGSDDDDGGGEASAGGAEAAEAAANGDGDVEWREWRREAPQRWFCFDADALSSFAFDAAEAAAAEEAEAETEATAAAEAEAEAPTAADAEAAAAEGPVRVEVVGEAVGRIPRELRTVQQAMRMCGYGAVPQAGATAREARELLRAVWRNVLQLSDAEAQAMRDDAPFGAFGGDSLLAVQVVALARLHGMPLPISAHICPYLPISPHISPHLRWSRSRASTGCRCRRRAASASRLRW